MTHNVWYAIKQSIQKQKMHQGCNENKLILME